MDYLTKNKITYEFVDFKKRTPITEDINTWSKSYNKIK